MNRDFYQNISSFTSEYMLDDLNALPAIIYGALETTQTCIVECMESLNDKLKGKDKNPMPQKIYTWLYPSLMRAIMQFLLHSKEIKTQAINEYSANVDNVIDWDREILSNNGLAGNWNGYNYKILKSQRRTSLQEELKLPPSGNSKKKQRFYGQKHLEQSRMNLFQDGENRFQRPNVIFLWDKINDKEVSLSLAVPIYGDINKAEDLWTVPIDHPVLTLPKIEPEEIIEKIDLRYLQPNEIAPSDIEDEDDIRD